MKTKSLTDIKTATRKILKAEGIVKAGIFGSYARGEQKKTSDIDIVIEFNESLLKLAKVERELNEALGKKVDVVTYKGLHPRLKKRIIKEQIKIL